MIAKISIISGPDEGQSITVGAGQSLIIGRSKKTDFRIRDSSISRKHCRIVNDGNQCLIEDLGSMNGTLLNGRKLESSKALYDRDQIVIGRTTLLFHIEIDDEYVPVGVGEEFELALEKLNESSDHAKSEGTPLESIGESEPAAGGIMIEEAAQEDAKIFAKPVDDVPDVSMDEIESFAAPVESEAEQRNKSSRLEPESRPNLELEAGDLAEAASPSPIDQKKSKEEKKEVLLLPVLWAGVKVQPPAEPPLMNGVQTILNRRVTMWDTGQPLSPNLREQLRLIVQLDHPGFARLIDLGVVNAKTYAAFTWMGPHSLEFYLQPENIDRLREHADAVARRICQAVKFAASKGIGFPVFQTCQIGFLPESARIRIVPIAPLKIGVGQDTIERTCASSLSNVLELLASLTKPDEKSWLARTATILRKIKPSMPTLSELLEKIDQVPT